MGGEAPSRPLPILPRPGWPSGARLRRWFPGGGTARGPPAPSGDSATDRACRRPARAAAVVTSSEGALPGGSCSRAGGAPPPPAFAGCGHARRFRFPLRLLPPPLRFGGSRRRRHCRSAVWRPRPAQPIRPLGRQAPPHPGESGPTCRPRLLSFVESAGPGLRRVESGGSSHGASGSAGSLSPPRQVPKAAGPARPRRGRLAWSGFRRAAVRNRSLAPASCGPWWAPLRPPRPREPAPVP